MDGGAWWAAAHGVAKSQTRLSNFTFTFHFHALEKEMATHSSVLAWRIPGTGEPGGLLSLGSHRVGHDWSDLAAAAASPPTQWGRAFQILIYNFKKETEILTTLVNILHLLSCRVRIWTQAIQLQTSDRHSYAVLLAMFYLVMLLIL